MATNRRLVDTDGADFYPTPEWGTLALLRYENFVGSITEPCCGDGAMAKVLERETKLPVYASDLYHRGYGFQRDIFDLKDKCANIVTNPPYNIANELVEHAYNITTHKLCILVRTAFLESNTRYKSIYSVNPPSRVYVFSERLSMYPANQPITGGGTTSYSWIVWDKSSKTNFTELKWIEPGLKPNKKKNIDKNLV